MKSILYLSFVILLTLSLKAKVGIGTTTPEAALDAFSTTDGLLIPRVALTDLRNLTVLTPKEYKIVYNITNNTFVTPGYYYLSADAEPWLRFGGSGWLLDGNPAVTAASFMVSINNADVVFKRNNVEAGRLSTNNTSFGTGALLTNAANAWNTAFVTNALGSITNGINNVAIGHNAQQNATSQRYNVALSFTALQQNTGERNTAIGHEALAFTGNNPVYSPTENVAIDARSL